MIIDDRHYDIIIIGSGAGGGTLPAAEDHRAWSETR